MAPDSTTLSGSTGTSGRGANCSVSTPCGPYRALSISATPSARQASRTASRSLGPISTVRVKSRQIRAS